MASTNADTEHVATEMAYAFHHSNHLVAELETSAKQSWFRGMTEQNRKVWLDLATRFHFNAIDAALNEERLRLQFTGEATTLEDGWWINSPGTLEPVKCESFEWAMGKLFEGFNPPYQVKEGKTENFSLSLARATTYLNK